MGLLSELAYWSNVCSETRMNSCPAYAHGVNVETRGLGVIKLLFVDDEMEILTSIRRAFYGVDPDWQLLFASSAAEAWEIASKNDLDVIVSDMRMAAVDGAELLSASRVELPNTIRLILSGYSDEYASIRGAVGAHQFFGKPCDMAQLWHTLRCLLEARDAVGDSAVTSMANRITSLPSARTTAESLFEILQDENLTAGHVERIVRQDPAFALQIARLGSSAFFGNPLQHVDLMGCVKRIGIDNLRQLSTMSEFFLTVEEYADDHALFVEKVRDHSVDVATFAAKNAEHDSGTAYLAGLLHGVGSLLLSLMGRIDFDAPCGWCANDPLVQSSTRYLLSLAGVPAPVSEYLDKNVFDIEGSRALAVVPSNVENGIL